MRRWALPLLCLPVAALLVLAVVILVRHEPGSSSPPPPASTPPTATPSPAATETLVRQLQGFVEQERGLSFKAPVKVTLLDDAAFRARAIQADEEDRKEMEEAQLVLRAMGLLGRDVDLVKTVESLIGAAVVGLYDPETDELLVRGAQATPGVRATMVHELTHALEDQHFNLDRQDLGDEADLGFAALVEGSALRVENAYLRSLPSAERKSAEQEERAVAGAVPKDVPEVVELALTFPYAYGPDVVSALLRDGGKARLDAAFADPPLSTEHAFDPRRYLRGDKPRPVPVPTADGPAFDDGEIGQLFLLLMLRSELGIDVARRAAEGWGGDRYVAWPDGDRTCVRMDFVMDDQRQTDELEDALRDWAEERGGSARSAGASVTTCG